MPQGMSEITPLYIWKTPFAIQKAIDAGIPVIMAWEMMMTQVFDFALPKGSTAVADGVAFGIPVVTDGGHIRKLEEVEAEVIDINHERGRISLSIRRLQPDPWESTVADFKVGDVIDGTVTKLVNFGAFVRVREGLEGLIHISELSHQRVAHPGDVAGQAALVMDNLVEALTAAYFDARRDPAFRAELEEAARRLEGVRRRAPGPRRTGAHRVSPRDRGARRPAADGRAGGGRQLA